MVIGITFTGIALIGVFLMYLFQASARKHRIFYRLSYIFLSICALIGIPMLCSYMTDEEASVRIFISIFWDFFILIALIYNVLCLKWDAQSKLVTTTLVNCTEKVIASRKRYNVRITGTSKEGLKDSFLMQYPKDIMLVKKAPVTPETVFIIKYYDKTKSIKSIERIN